MNKKQSSYFEMLTAVKNVFETYESAISSVSSLSRLVNRFNGLMDSLLEISQEQNGGVSGMTVVRKQKRKMLTKLTLKITSGMYVYAIDKNKTDLKIKVDFSLLALDNMGGAQLAQYAYSIWQEAIMVDEALMSYGVTPGDIFNLKVEIDSFTRLDCVTKAGQTDRSAVAVHSQELLNEARLLLNEKIDKIMIVFRENDLDLFSGYQAARVVEKQSVRVRPKTHISMQ